MNKLLKSLMQSREERRSELYRALIRREARLGGQLFGPIPAGHRREFFCLDRHTWVWHEEWLDPTTRRQQVVTTRYDVRPSSVLKTQGDNQYRPLSTQEARHLLGAVRLYRERVLKPLYPTAY